MPRSRESAKWLKGNLAARIAQSSRTTTIGGEAECPASVRNSQDITRQTPSDRGVGQRGQEEECWAAIGAPNGLEVVELPKGASANQEGAKQTTPTKCKVV